MKDILEKVAVSNGVTRDEVESASVGAKYIIQEIQKAIKEAMKSRQPQAQRFWKEVSPDGQIPSVETVIALIVEQLNKRMCS